jgi:hypothetical protein
MGQLNCERGMISNAGLVATGGKERKVVLVKDGYLYFPARRKDVDEPLVLSTFGASSIEHWALGTEQSKGREQTHEFRAPGEPGTKTMASRQGVPF